MEHEILFVFVSIKLKYFIIFFDYVSQTSLKEWFRARCV